MLVLERKLDEVIHIGKGIRIMVTHIGHDYVRLGIDAPRDVPIVRAELRASGKAKKVIMAKPDGMFKMELEQHFRPTRKRAIELGRMLSACKAALPRGCFLSWLNDNPGLVRGRTAQRYMQRFAEMMASTVGGGSNGQ